MKVGKNKYGFTIVELLIVIVVIAILAAITIVAYNGIQTRSRASMASSDVQQNAKLIMTAAVEPSSYIPSLVMDKGLNAAKFNTSQYKVVTYCANATDFALLVETTSGQKFYQRASGGVVNNNSVDSFMPCNSLGISSAFTTYLNLPASCANEYGTCVLSGTGTIVYGSAAQGRFNRALNQSGTINCNNTAYGDAAPTYQKACYFYPN